MSKKSPDIIFKCKFLQSLDKSNFDNSYDEYRQNDVEKMIDYYSNPKERVSGMFDYYDGLLTNNNYNLVLENGKYATDNDIKMYKKNYCQYIKKSNLWKGILSFNNDYLLSNIDLKTLEQKFSKDIMPKFLKYCGFKNTKDMSYMFAIHTKSKSGHIHIHFSFVEKKPNYIYDHKVGYRIKGSLTDDEKDYLKRLTALCIEREKNYSPKLKQINNDIDDLKSFFKPSEKNFILKDIDNILLEEKIIKLGELVYQYRDEKNNSNAKTKYNSIEDNELGKEIKKLTKEIKICLFNDKNSSLYNSNKKLKEDMNKLNDYYKKLDENLHITKSKIKNNLINEKQDYIDNFIYNAIINHILYKRKQDKINLDEIIQESAYQKKIESDKKRRKNILHNYFFNNNIISKFPNKYKLEQSLKKISNEMNEATNEFSNLFNYDDFSKKL